MLVVGFFSACLMLPAAIMKNFALAALKAGKMSLF